MYLKNPYYLEALQEENKKIQARIKAGDITLINKDIKSLKYDLSINDNKFTIGGVHGATIDLVLLNYEEDFSKIKFENRDFVVDLKIAMSDLYTVGQVHKMKVGEVNSLKIKHLTSLWVPQGKFYPTEIKRNENRTISLKLIDKTKYLDGEYVCSLKPPFTLKQLYDDVHKYFQIASDTSIFYNQDEVVEKLPVGYTGKQIIGYIAECACGFYIVNRLGNGQIGTYGLETVKAISKGKYKKFLPAENYITIQKIKYANGLIGANRGYILEIDEKNPFVTDTVAQNILVKMQGFTFIPYEYQSVSGDFAVDVGNKFDITNTADVKYTSFVMQNSWTFNGAISQNWKAKAENDLSNTYSMKGPISQQIDSIVNEQIPNIKEEAVEKATELITDFNGGYVVKKDGELFISDNEDLDKAQHLWRWNINGLGYSSTGIAGPYGLAMTMDGKIVADFITTGTMSAERINGGTLKLGGINNTNGSIQVVDGSNNELVVIGKDGLILKNGTKLIGGAGVLSEFQFGQNEWQRVGFETDIEISSNSYLFIDIPVSIPQNFIITEAYLVLKHASIKNVSSSENVWGVCKNIRIYKDEKTDTYFEERQMFPSEGYWTSNIFTNEIQNAFDGGSFTASSASDNKHVVETVKSKNISDYINDKTIIQIRSGNQIPDFKPDTGFSSGIYYFQKNCLNQTGLIKANLQVIGYIQ